MGAKGILGGGLLSDSKTVKQVTDPVKKYGMGAGASAASNFEEDIKSRAKSNKDKTRGGLGLGGRSFL
jgi:hypothetical protein